MATGGKSHLSGFKTRRRNVQEGGRHFKGLFGWCQCHLRHSEETMVCANGTGHSEGGPICQHPGKTQRDQGTKPGKPCSGRVPMTFRRALLCQRSLPSEQRCHQPGWEAGRVSDLPPEAPGISGHSLSRGRADL